MGEEHRRLSEMGSMVSNHLGSLTVTDWVLLLAQIANLILEWRKAHQTAPATPPLPVSPSGEPPQPPATPTKDLPETQPGRGQP